MHFLFVAYFLSFNFNFLGKLLFVSTLILEVESPKIVMGKKILYQS